MDLIHTAAKIISFSSSPLAFLTFEHKAPKNLPSIIGISTTSFIASFTLNLSTKVFNSEKISNSLLLIDGYYG